jgi:hypothetical protein
VVGKLWKRYAVVVGWSIGLGAFLWYLDVSVIYGAASRWDFAIYLTAANALRHDPHATIYSLSTLAATHAAYGSCAPPAGWGYLYQPIFALALVPLTFLPCGAATLLWNIFNVATMLACVGWLTRWTGQRYGPRAAAFTVALCALCLPIYNGLYFGQVHILLLAICLGAVSLLRRGHPRWAGALLAVGAFIKYLPVLLLFYYISRRHWGAALGAALATAGLGLLELAIVGPATLRASLVGGSANLFATPSVSVYNIWPYEGSLVSALALGICALVFLVLARWPARAAATIEPGLSIGEAWAIGAMAFASPVIWYHYFTWLLPSAVVLLMMAWRARAKSLGWLWLGGLAFLITGAFFNPLSVAEDIESVAALCLWLACTVILLRQIGVPLPFAQRISERGAISQTARQNVVESRE